MPTKYQLKSRPVEGFPGYLVCENGRVMSVKGRKTIALRTRINAAGYRQVSLRKDRKPATLLVHRLVAQCFIPNPDGLPQVNHKNGEKTDNRASNLEWVSRGDNQRHAYKAGLMSRAGSKNTQAVIDEGMALKIAAAVFKESSTSIATRLGVSRHIVRNIRKGLAWSHITGIKDPPPIGNRGKFSGTAKITEETACEVVRLLRAERPTDVARRLGITYAIVRNIRDGPAWSHVTGIPPKRPRTPSLVPVLVAGTEFGKGKEGKY